MGQDGAMMGQDGAKMEPRGSHIGALGVFGGLWRDFGRLGGDFGSLWGCFGELWGGSGSFWEEKRGAAKPNSLYIQTPDQPLLRPHIMCNMLNISAPAAHAAHPWRAPSLELRA